MGKSRRPREMSQKEVQDQALQEAQWGKPAEAQEEVHEEADDEIQEAVQEGAGASCYIAKELNGFQS